MMRSVDGTKPPIIVDCDFVAVMASDFVFRACGTNAAAASHPEMLRFIELFTRYFHMPGAELAGPILLEPARAVRERSDSADTAARASAWFSQKVAEAPRTASVLCVSMADRSDFEPPAGARRMACDLRVIPVEPGSADVLLALDFIDGVGLGAMGEPLEPCGWRRTLRSLATALKPGGSLLVCARIGAAECVVFDSRRVLRRDALLAALEEFTLRDEHVLSLEPDAAAVERLRDGEFISWCFMLEKPRG